jgi:hypothetical protein
MSEYEDEYKDEFEDDKYAKIRATLTHSHPPKRTK